MANDIAVGPYIGSLPVGAAVARKPAYLITLEGYVGKNLVQKRFISLDKPEFLQGFIQVKGIFSDSSEEEISSKFNDILASSSKDLFIEVMFPCHKVCSIRNLIFRAK